ncbi:MAG: hypothetical protein ACREFB_13605 [Stellaceae bacterium]
MAATASPRSDHQSPGARWLPGHALRRIITRAPALEAELPANGEREHTELLRRFALDLRRGAFETSGSRERAARAILWRMVILMLGEWNPQFLAAHGIK